MSTPPIPPLGGGDPAPGVLSDLRTEQEVEPDPLAPRARLVLSENRPEVRATNICLLYTFIFVTHKKINIWGVILYYEDDS